MTIEIPQDSFRLYFRDIPDMPFGWLKLKHGDIVCDKMLILAFWDEAIEKHLIWTVDQIRFITRTVLTMYLKAHHEKRGDRDIVSRNIFPALCFCRNVNKANVYDERGIVIL